MHGPETGIIPLRDEIAWTPLCRYQLGVGIYTVQAAINGMDGGKRSYAAEMDGHVLAYIMHAVGGFPRSNAPARDPVFRCLASRAHHEHPIQPSKCAGCTEEDTLPSSPVSPRVDQAKAQFFFGRIIL